MARPRTKAPKSVETIRHAEDTRTNIPTAEYQSVLRESEMSPVRVAYERRNRDLDPQLVWRGKDEQDWSDLVVDAPPLFIQEKVHPKVLIDELVRQSAKSPSDSQEQMDLFADFNRLPDGADKTDFYEHEQGWTNRMILGDSLQVMASLAEREGLRGKVQCIYIDPPYGIKFNSNFQWSTTDKSGTATDSAVKISREPEQVKAFRDTWRDGIHSYLTYLRDRLTVARDLLSESGSVFVQIGDENVHRIRAVLDEVFGEDNFIVQLAIQKTGSQTGDFVQSNVDTLLWFSKSRKACKFRPLFADRQLGGSGGSGYTNATLQDGRDVPISEAQHLLDDGTLEVDRIWRSYPLTSDGFRDTTTVVFPFEDREFFPGRARHWGVVVSGLERVGRAGRLITDSSQVHLKRYFGDSPSIPLGSVLDQCGGRQREGVCGADERQSGPALRLDDH